jgi:hypothetical protein
MTGFDFDKLFDRKTDKAYTGFFNPTKKTALYREALILAIENKYRNLDEQREYDDLSGVTKTNQVYSLLPSQANQIYTQPLAISAITVTSSQLIITTVFPHYLAVGQNMTTFYVQQISSFSFQLFTDKALATPVVGNANYVSGGIMAKVDYQYASPLVPDRKKDMYSAATSIYPKAETANGMLKIQPFDLSCTEITIDYITTDLVDINPLDSALNLELTYPADFLYYVADTAANLAAKTVRDQELLQTSTTDINNEK